MATVLFINRTDLVRNSIIDGNVDTDKFIQFIKIAQQIDIQQIIGTNMYTGLTDAIVAGIDLPGNARWKTILDDYIVCNAYMVRTSKLYTICSLPNQKWWCI